MKKKKTRVKIGGKWYTIQPCAWTGNSLVCESLEDREPCAFRGSDECYSDPMPCEVNNRRGYPGTSVVLIEETSTGNKSEVSK